jgi:hypothetical protein
MDVCMAKFSLRQKDTPSDLIEVVDLTEGILRSPVLTPSIVSEPRRRRESEQEK